MTSAAFMDFLEPQQVTGKSGKTYTISPRCLNGYVTRKIRAYLKSKQEDTARVLLSVTPKDSIPDVAARLFSEMQNTLASEIKSLLDPEVQKIVLTHGIEETQSEPEKGRTEAADDILSTNSIYILSNAILLSSGEHQLKNFIHLLGHGSETQPKEDQPVSKEKNQPTKARHSDSWLENTESLPEKSTASQT